MTQRERLIWERGQAIFNRENKNPLATFGDEFVNVGAPGSEKSKQRAIDEDQRAKILHRAEQELIKENAISK